MTEFGQNIIPRIYEDNTFRTFSKAGFLSHMIRALETVGMLPLRSLWPYDPIANPEFPIQENAEYFFPFDYPDDGGTLTWSVSGTLYRPCLVVAMYHGNEDDTDDPTRLDTTVLVENILRLDGVPTIENMFSQASSRPTPSHSGLIGLGISTGAYSTIYPNTDGNQIQKPDWLPYAGSGAGNQSKLPVGHWFLYLGTGGLQVFVGSGGTRVEFGDLMAMGALFAGARLPGRARPVTEDSNLGRINPIAPMYWHQSVTSTNGETFFSTSTSATNEPYFKTFRPKIVRMQADLKATTEIVNSWLYNLENVEYPIYPLYEADTRPSPRAITGGGGGHILGFGVLVPDHRELNVTDKFGPVVPELNAVDVRPQWEDVFTGGGFRLCDVTAPLGLHTDPNTLFDWYLVPTYNSNQLVGLLHEGGTTVSVLDSLTLTDEDDDDYYDLTGASGWGNSFPTSVVIVETGTNDTVWDDASAADEQTFVVPSVGSTQTYQVEWTIDISGSDPVDTVYFISFEANNLNDPDTDVSEGGNNLTFEYLFDGSWIPVITIECAGANTGFVNSEGEFSYSTQEYTASVSRNTSGATPTLTVRWNVVGEPNDRCDGAVGVIIVHKFRYL